MVDPANDSPLHGHANLNQSGLFYEFHRLLEQSREVPQKYFLSPNAAKGILRRADRMGRSLFPPLREALEILAKGQSSESLYFSSTGVVQPIMSAARWLEGTPYDLGPRRRDRPSD